MTVALTAQAADVNLQSHTSTEEKVGRIHAVHESAEQTSPGRPVRRGDLDEEARPAVGTALGVPSLPAS
ncbi:hypothetical protein [Streptomyces sp. NPDC050388]|uniref:hypothetical protein n=1 Tax=Streptomyces sp. NPDC050388 TaxID=3155781 RepID=UPI00343772A3